MKAERTPQSQLTPEIAAELSSPLAPDVIRQITSGPQSGAQYVPIDQQEQTLNLIFGYAGWTYELVRIEITEVFPSQSSSKRDGFQASAEADVILVAGGIRRPGAGSCTSLWQQTQGQARGFAREGAISMALKSAVETWGPRFGITLKDKAKVDPYGLARYHGESEPGSNGALPPRPAPQPAPPQPAPTYQPQTAPQQPVIQQPPAAQAPAGYVPPAAASGTGPAPTPQEHAQGYMGPPRYATRLDVPPPPSGPAPAGYQQQPPPAGYQQQPPPAGYQQPAAAPPPTAPAPTQGAALVPPASANAQLIADLDRLLTEYWQATGGHQGGVIHPAAVRAKVNSPADIPALVNSQPAEWTRSLIESVKQDINQLRRAAA